MTWYEWLLAVGGTWILTSAFILGAFALATGKPAPSFGTRHDWEWTDTDTYQLSVWARRRLDRTVRRHPANRPPFDWATECPELGEP